MKKKIACWVINTSIVFAVMLAVLKVASVLISTNGIENNSGNSGLYSLSVSDSSSAGYRLGATILRPIIEARIDNYIREQGLEEYFKSLKLQMPPKSSFSYSDTQEGVGPKVMCGQDITATILSTQTGGTEKVTYSSHDKMASPTDSGFAPISFRLGTHRMPEINYALPGMQKDTGRIIVVDSEKFSGSHYVNLLSIDSPELDEGVMERFMVFEKAKPSTNEAVSVFRCGDKVSVMYNLRNAAGNILVREKTETFTIGEGTVPMALELASVDLRSDIIRSVIVPPELLQGFNNISDHSSIKIIEVWFDHQAGAVANSPD